MKKIVARYIIIKQLKASDKESTLKAAQRKNWTTPRATRRRLEAGFRLTESVAVSFKPWEEILKSLSTYKSAPVKISVRNKGEGPPGGPVPETLCPQCRGLGSIPSQGTRSYMLQRKVLHAATKTGSAKPINILKKEKMRMRFFLRKLEGFNH